MAGESANPIRSVLEQLKGAGDAAAPLPPDVIDAVSATAAESLLMGIFVLVCSFELRGVKAGLAAAHRGAASPLPTLAKRSGGGGAALPSVRSTSSPCPEQVAPFRGSASGTPPDCDAGSVYGADDGLELAAHWTPGSTEEPQASAACSWEIGQLVMMMVLLHVIYPSFPLSPQVEVGRIITFLGFLWSIGPMRCIAVVNTEPVHVCKLLFLVVLGVIVHACIFVMTDTISDLIFPEAGRMEGLYQGPRYLHQLFTYLATRYPARTSSFGPWAAWSVVGMVVFSSAVWKEFLFRGVYLGGLRTGMPFWVANVTSALIYAFAHEPLQLSNDGSVRLQIVSCAPLLMGALWHGYLYHSCNNLVVTVLAHLIFNAGLLALHIFLQAA